MGRIMVNSDEKPTGGHLHHEGRTGPMRLSFLDVKDKDLPHEGKLSARGNSKLCEGVDFALLEDTVGHKGEGKLILAALTGVRVSKKLPTVPALLPLEGHEGKNLDLFHTTSNPVASELGQKGLKHQQRGDLGAKTDRNLRYEPIKTDGRALADIGVDTRDLVSDVAAAAAEKNDPEGTWLFETEAEEDLYNRTNDAGFIAGAGETIRLQDYLKLIKATRNKIEMRAVMLEELKLAEDIEPVSSDYRDPETEHRGGGGGGRPKSADSGAMCATSLVVKQARRLVGMLDHDRRVLDLTEVGLWLQRLVKEQESVVDPGRALKGKISRKGSQIDRVIDWRLPISPEVAILYAQDDIRERLGLQSKSKQIMGRKRAELEAAKTLMADMALDDDAMREYLQGVNNSEAEAQLMGTGKQVNIIPNTGGKAKGGAQPGGSKKDKMKSRGGGGDGDGGGGSEDMIGGGIEGSGFPTMGTGYSTMYLSQDEGYSSAGASSSKKNKRGKKRKKGKGSGGGIGGGGSGGGHGYEGGVGAADALYEATKAKSKVGGTSSPGEGSSYGGYSPTGMNNISTSLSGGSGSEESSTFGGGGGGEGSRGVSSRRSLKNGFGLERGTTVGVLEANALYVTTGGEKKTTRSIGTQTDNNMGGTMDMFSDDEDDDKPRHQENNESPELARMRKEMLKLKKQLRFWRARSWVAKHRLLLARSPVRNVEKLQAEVVARVMPGAKRPPIVESPNFDKRGYVMAPLGDRRISPNPGRRIRNFQLPELHQSSLQQQRQGQKSEIGTQHGVTSKQTTPRAARIAPPPKYNTYNPNFHLSPLVIIGRGSPIQTPRGNLKQSGKKNLSPLTPRSPSKK